MVKFKIIISNPEDGKAKSLEVEGTNAQTLIGRTINEIVDGSIFDLKGKKIFGMTPASAGFEMATRGYLEVAGLEFNKDVKILSMGSSTQGVSMVVGLMADLFRRPQHDSQKPFAFFALGYQQGK